jgi:hypothetical protein
MKHSEGRPKTVDNWRLADIFKAIEAAAKHPTAGEVLVLKTKTHRTVFNFRGSLKTAVERFRTQVGRVTAYKLAFDQTKFVLVVMHNIHRATQQHYGRDFRELYRTLTQLYLIDHQHDDASLQDVLDQLQEVDIIRDYSLAPAPEQANSVADEMDVLLNYVQQESVDYQESALAASDSESDSDSSRGTRLSTKSNKLGRGRNEGQRGHGGKHDNSRTRRRSPFPEKRWQDNPCKYCRLYKRRNQHPKIREKDCYFNKDLKVYCPYCICKEVMEIPFVPRYKIKDDE